MPLSPAPALLPSTLPVPHASQPSPARTQTPLPGRTVVFVHAHPDDEAIFTAVTMHALARAGVRVVLVVATGGELGDPLTPLPAGTSLAAHRIVELERSAAALGVSRLVLLGRRDSGCPGWPSNSHPASLMRADQSALAATVADLALTESADAIVGYDPAGIYGHPDHVAVHHIAEGAARLAGVTSYQATVDPAHVDRHQVHLVLGAAPATGTSQIGVPASGVSVTVHAGREDLAAKRAAMLAHASQIPAEHVRAAGFDDAYGTEWYVRSGPVGVLEDLAGAPARQRRPGR